MNLFSLNILLGIALMFFGTLGITIGAHRLWAHQSYQASWIIRLGLMLAHTIAGVVRQFLFIINMIKFEELKKIFFIASGSNLRLGSAAQITPQILRHRPGSL